MIDADKQEGYKLVLHLMKMRRVTMNLRNAVMMRMKTQIMTAMIVTHLC